MTEKVWVAIKGTRTIGGEMEKVDESGRGDYYKRNEKHYILWRGDGNAAKRIRIAEDSMTVAQENGTNAMSFEKGSDTRTLYGAFGANVLLEIRTRKFFLRQEENFLEAEVEYSLYHDGLHLSNNNLKVTVRSWEE